MFCKSHFYTILLLNVDLTRQCNNINYFTFHDHYFNKMPIQEPFSINTIRVTFTSFEDVLTQLSCTRKHIIYIDLEYVIQLSYIYFVVKGFWLNMLTYHKVGYRRPRR